VDPVGRRLKKDAPVPVVVHAALSFPKIISDVVVVQPGQDWDGDNDTGPLDPAAFEGSGLPMAHMAEFIPRQLVYPSF
jgi:hypothetical protein